MKELGNTVSQNRDIIVHFTEYITLFSKAKFFFLLGLTQVKLLER